MRQTLIRARLLAKLIDLAIVISLGILIPKGIGSVIGFLYSLVADGLPFRHFHGASIGKRAIGLRVVNLDGEPASMKVSVIRNLPVGFVTFLMIIPFWGWILSLLIGIPLALIELILIGKGKMGQRLGDIMADTRVISQKL